MPENEPMKYTKLILLEAIFLLSIPLFFAVVWMPVYQVVSGDILMQGSLFLLLWDFLKSALIYLFAWFSIVLLILSLIFFGWKRSLPLLGFYLLGSAIRSIGTAVSSAIVLHEFDDILIDNIWDAALDVLFDLLLVSVFCLICYFTLIRKRSIEERKKLLPPAVKGFSPVPLHLAVLLSVSVFYAVQVYSRIRYDIFYGAPANGMDLAWMIFYYIADSALAVFGYFAVVLILKKLTIPKKKK